MQLSGTAVRYKYMAAPLTVLGQNSGLDILLANPQLFCIVINGEVGFWLMQYPIPYYNRCLCKTLRKYLHLVQLKRSHFYKSPNLNKGVNNHGDEKTKIREF